MQHMSADPRFAPAVITAASIMMLGGALLFQYVGGLQPCVLCIYQRYPYAIAIALGLTALALGSRPEGVKLSKLFVYACAAVFLAGMAVAAFHVGVEQKWWQGTAECHAPQLPANATVEQLREILLNQPFAPCDRIPWELFGISIAGFNVLASALLAALAFWAAFKLGALRKEARP